MPRGGEGWPEDRLPDGHPGGPNVEIRNHSACLMPPPAGGLLAKEAVSKTSWRQ